MKASDIFGLIVRTIGLIVVLISIAIVVERFSWDWTSPPALFSFGYPELRSLIQSVALGGVGLVLVFGAPVLVRLSYGLRSNKDDV